VQWYSGPEGDQRIWYEPEDIEQIATEQLRRADLMPTLDDPVTDVERLIEGHLRAELDLYADLPDGVLGLTQFPARGAPKVLIDSALTEARDAEHAPTGVVGRWRATLAHEASHIFLHRYLFDSEMAQLAGRGGVAVLGEGGLMRCLHRDISPTVADWSSMRRRSDWREVQANRAMAALLMPRRLFRRLALREMRQLCLGTPPVAVPEVEGLATALADLLQVSKQAARIRLDSEGLIAQD
jgi:IrrE N-terminal-like domain